MSFHPESSIAKGTFDIFLGLPPDMIRFIFLVIGISSILAVFSPNLLIKRWAALLNVAEYLWMTISFIVRNPLTVSSGTFMCITATAFVLFLKLSIQEQEEAR